MVFIQHALISAEKLRLMQGIYIGQMTCSFNSPEQPQQKGSEMLTPYSSIQYQS